MNPSVRYCDNCCREESALVERRLYDQSVSERSWIVSLCGECAILLDHFKIEDLAARRGVHAGVTVVERNPREVR